MKMLRYTLAPVLVALASPAAADQLSLKQLSDHLNSFRSAAGEFTQINDDGSISTGRIFIKRPGNARFEYDPPNQALVMAGQRAVAIFDPKGNTGPEVYPLNQTPLSVILRETVDLDGADMGVDHSYDGTATTVTAMDAENAEYGNIPLVFTDNPVQLRQWVINDQSGGATTVVLGQMTYDPKLRSRLFDINAETESRQGTQY
jgi:outer membrane lipoprotein-sorting protein